MNRFHHLARLFDGDVLQPAWRRDEPHLGSLAGIRFHYTNSAEHPAVLRPVWDLVFYLVAAWRLLRRGARYDCVIAFGFFKTALAGWLLARLSGARFILEVAVRQERIVKLSDRRSSRFTRLADRARIAFAGFLLGRADRLRLMYPGQIDVFPCARGIPADAFPDFVPVSALEAQPHAGIVLIMGSPLYLKGADLAIAAFGRIAGEFPLHRLLVVGHGTDLPRFKTLARNVPRVQFADPLPYDQAMDLLARACCVLVPSRSDAMPRVAIEAMALGKPLIAAAVDGLAHYLRHEETALLCPPDDAEAMSDMLRAVLSDPALAAGLGERARRWALAHCSEVRYVERFYSMARACLA